MIVAFVNVNRIALFDVFKSFRFKVLIVFFLVKNRLILVILPFFGSTCHNYPICNQIQQLDPWLIAYIIITIFFLVHIHFDWLIWFLVIPMIKLKERKRKNHYLFLSNIHIFLYTVETLCASSSFPRRFVDYFFSILRSKKVSKKNLKEMPE